MPTYVHNGSAWQELTGTDRPYAYAAGAFQPITQIYAHNGSAWQQVYQYDSTPPTIPTPTVVKNGSSFDVTWGAITDTESGVASATIQQVFIGSTSGFVNGSTYSIPSGSFSGGTTTMTVPTNRRNTPSGETWQVAFEITATDVANNSATGSGSIYEYTRPLGTYYVTATGHGTYGSNGGWRSDLGTIGNIYSGWIGSTYGYQYGHWFYGTSVASAARGFAPDSGTIRTYRSSADGCSGAVVAFGTHNYGSQPSGAPANDTTYYTTGTSQNQGSAREFTLTSATLGRIATNANFGMFMYPGYSNGTVDGTASTSCASGSTYRVFDSPFSDANSGRLTLVYN